MTSILSAQKVSKRSLTLNKSFFLSLVIHLCLIFGITFTTFYKMPLLESSSIINVKFANASEDVIGQEGSSSENISQNTEESDFLSKKEINENNFQAYKVKKLEANSTVNNEEAMYLNLWQRNIESSGDKMISATDKILEDSKVQIMATIDSFGNLIKSEILISSGDRSVDEMAIKILEESAPFAPFDPKMLNEYSFLEIVRDWNFSSN
ncbi:TonB C-terminal domain-containing protein [Gammaproteobacteria bacterium]|jgi:outer membrane biosynthesis protein TonB|nr:TonB C-terminal domain-containing protein [Gammaproteobacteria bacterium]MDA9342796.1 TonB C-terminal domain-containing protein [Gammaproteobacteria bacterium]MDA9356549.1 TonB C-terminal domain-containing protein [Gammaproteobacteria bacterium]MDB2582161.1 TonB C-terminal domain-containing protein [Gammaproteobacteria bacterium]MDB4120199.1 TonB C-terminal domain-containing protein [Gammaproteobacteria bacterium]|tara:strand:+ start:123 stop:749 length:627 start_codon:yes stop_codon:yes gene_type:complete